MMYPFEAAEYSLTVDVRAVPPATGVAVAAVIDPFLLQARIIVPKPPIINNLREIMAVSCQPLMTCRAAPQLFKTLVAAAAVSVIRVSDRVFPVVLLVIFFGRIKFSGSSYFGHDRLIERFALLESSLRLKSSPTLPF
jgi:hypothetical protein